MGLKRVLFCNNKHYWHLSNKKLKRMDRLFDLILSEHSTLSAGRYVNINSKERR